MTPEEYNKIKGIDVTYNGGKPAKMVSIFFGEVQLITPSGECILMQESELDTDWRVSK